MSRSTNPTKQDDADLATYHEAKRMLERLGGRLDAAMEDDVKEMRLLHKHLVSCERRAQEREA